MRRPGHRVAATFLVACAAVVGAILIFRMNDYSQARKEYAQYNEPIATSSTLPTQKPTTAAALDDAIAELARSTPVPAPTAEPFFSDKVYSFMKQNDDAVAYIDVLDTTVQYPVVQGTDNEYYLTHTFAGKHRATGAIFMDAWNSNDFSDFNTIIYGHNMKDGSMFHLLREYKKSSFLSDHKYIEMTLLRSKRTYKVFAAYSVEDDFDFRGFGCQTEAERAAFLKRIAYRSEIKTNATASADDSILTLVTCTSGDRSWYWIVHAVLMEEITTKE